MENFIESKLLLIIASKIPSIKSPSKKSSPIKTPSKSPIIKEISKNIKDSITMDQINKMINKFVQDINDTNKKIELSQNHLRNATTQNQKSFIEKRLQGFEKSIENNPIIYYLKKFKSMGIDMDINKLIFILQTNTQAILDEYNYIDTNISKDKRLEMAISNMLSNFLIY